MHAYYCKFNLLYQVCIEAGLFWCLCPSRRTKIPISLSDTHCELMFQIVAPLFANMMNYLMETYPYMITIKLLRFVYLFVSFLVYTFLLVQSQFRGVFVANLE